MRTFFDRLEGVRTLAFDVPYLSLAGAGDECGSARGAATSAPIPRAANPPGLLREIDARFGPHPAWAIEHRHAWRRPEELAEVAEALADGARRRAAIVRWLANRYPDWDLLLTVLTESHSAAECFGHGLAARPPLAEIPTAASRARAPGRRLPGARRGGRGDRGRSIRRCDRGGLLAAWLRGEQRRRRVDGAASGAPASPAARPPADARSRPAGAGGASGFPPILLRGGEDWSSFMSDWRRGGASASLARLQAMAPAPFSWPDPGGDGAAARRDRNPS